MKMKNFKIIFLILILNLILNACGTVKEAFDPQRKNSSDEFLVEKKSPLSMPPDFEKLPKPKSKEDGNIQEDDNNIKTLIINTQNNNSYEKDQSSEDSRNLEDLIIYLINHN